MADRLSKLAIKYGTDKVPCNGHSYTPYYYKLFKDMKVKKLLEIGIGTPETMSHIPNYKTGASLRMWRDFFPEALIYGCDIRRKAMFEEERIKTYICDQSKKLRLLEMMEEIGNIDIIIDDGSHKTSDQIFSAKVLLPFTKLYIIEDVHEPELIKAEFPKCKIKKFKGISDINDQLIWLQQS